MATLYITSTANTGTGTLRTLISSAAAGDVIQPSPTLFPSGTVCEVSLTATLSITKNLTIQGGQTRLVLSSSGSNFYIGHGTSSSIPSYINYTDVDFRGFYTTSSGAIRCQYCQNHTFLRCSFCGIKGYSAPVAVSYSSVVSVVFQDCAFYGNIATQNSSNAGGALYFSSATIAGKCSLINCTLGANYRAYNSSRYNYGKSPVVVNLINTAAQEAEWKTPPASTYGYSTWTATSYQSMNPRPSATASWRTGATSTTSTIDLDGKARKTNGALGAYEYYADKLATPTNLTAYDITPGGFTLTWSNVTNANSYKVTCNGVTTTVYSNVKTFTGLSPLTTYPVSVVACDSNGAYLDSDAATTSVTTPEDEYLPPITPPPSIVDALISANGLYFEWNQPTGTAYVVVKIYQGSTSGTVLYNHTFDATYNSYTYSPVVANQAYIVGLQALPIEDSEKWSPSEESYSEPYSYGSATQLAKPTIHGFPRASGSTIYTTLQIRLAATIENATTYEYQIALDSNFTNGVLTRTSSTVSSGYPVSGYFTGLTSGTTYYCRARAKGDGVQYSDSEWSTVQSTQVASQLATPVVTVSGLSQTTATLSWGAVANRSSYTVKWRVVGASTWNQTTGLTTTSKALTGLTLGTTYEYEVIAVGNGSTYITSEAATGTFTTVALITLDTPTNLASSNITNNSATVSWTGDDRATQFKVEWRASGASTWEEKLVTA